MPGGPRVLRTLPPGDRTSPLGKVEIERRAPGRALEADVAAHVLDDRLGDAQAEARAPAIGRGGLGELLEDAAVELLRHPGSAVRDPHPDPAVAPGRPDDHG